MTLTELLKKIKFSDFISIDLETTGLSFEKDEIIEISALHFKDGKLFNEFNSLIKPNSQIPKKITKITGITNDMVKNSPKIENIFDNFLDFIDDHIIVGHNISFDYNFINHQCMKDNKILNIKHMCDTLILSRSLLFNFDKFNLEFLSSEFELDIKNAHRARNDALNTGFLFLKLVQQIASLPSQIIRNINLIINERLIYNSFLFKNILKYLNDEDFEQLIEYKLNDNILINKNNNYSNYKLNLDNWFNSDGIFDKILDEYSVREGQIQLSNDIFNSLVENKNLIAEAGAGLGKSLAYLTSALKYIKKYKDKKIIISTYTKTLQEQLFNKDLPIFSEMLDMDIKAVILKGKNNYLSKNKLYNLIHKNHINMDDTEIYECITLIVWSYFTKTGDVEECNGFDKLRYNDLWNSVSYSLNSNKFNFDKNDYYKRVIEQVKDSDILIVNHSLLCNDLSSNNPIIPNSSILIADEAHNIVSAIRNHLTESFTDNMILSIFYNYKNKLYELQKNNSLQIKDSKMLLERVNHLISKINYHLNDFKNMYEDIYLNLDYNRYDFDLSSRDHLIFSELNFDFILKKLDELSEINKQLEILKISKKELMLLQSPIDDLKKIIYCLIKNDSDYVKWISLYRKSNNYHFEISISDTNIQKYLGQKIYKNFTSTILCSATFSINESFDFYLTKIGAKNNISFDFDTKIYKSPFFYEEQSKYYIYSNNINVNSEEYLKIVANQITEISTQLSKRILVLCTSYKQVNYLSTEIKKIDTINENIFIQTSKFSKNSILRNFKKYHNSILIGTSTFWEGIDLPKDLLQVLFIVRIPFGNPNNPFTKYQSQRIESVGGNSFYDLELPEAILKIKQGIGRLIRTDLDSGVCFITDPRICNSRYGQFIINELPVKPETYKDTSEIIDSIDNFLGK